MFLYCFTYLTRYFEYKHLKNHAYYTIIFLSLFPIQWQTNFQFSNVFNPKMYLWFIVMALIENQKLKVLNLYSNKYLLVGSFFPFVWLLHTIQEQQTRLCSWLKCYITQSYQWDSPNDLYIKSKAKTMPLKQAVTLPDFWMLNCAIIISATST